MFLSLTLSTQIPARRLINLGYTENEKADAQKFLEIFWIFFCFLFLLSLHQNYPFPWRISSVNISKLTENCIFTTQIHKLSINNFFKYSDYLSIHLWFIQGFSWILAKYKIRGIKEYKYLCKITRCGKYKIPNLRVYLQDNTPTLRNESKSGKDRPE